MPDTISYDLLHQPWLPCERPNGSRVLVGIEEALIQAHTFSALHDESPLVTATLHRLLLAILQRVFLPETMAEWVTLWDVAAFHPAKVRDYLTKWKDRFDLFHPDRPFLQVANLRQILQKERGKDPEATEAWRLSLEASRYSGATSLFEALPPEHGLEPKQAARALLGYLGFTPGGRIQNESESWKAGPLRGGAVVLLRADTLHKTLLSNLVWQPRRQPLDLPPWEREASTPRATRAPYGQIDILVWPSRRVELIPRRDTSGTVFVQEVITAAGQRLEADTPDPMFGYVVRDPKRPPLAIRIEKERSVWRDAAALFDAATGADVFRRPAACTQLAELVRDGIVPRAARFQVEILGLASNQAAIDLWREDRMPLPPVLFTDGPRLSALRQSLSHAEDLAKAIDFKVLGTLAENTLAPSNRDAHKEDVRQLKDALGAMSAYWSTLGQNFGVWLDALGSTEDIDAEVARWKGILRATARKVVADAELHLGTGARALQAGAKANQKLRRVLLEVLGTPVGSAPTQTATATTEGATA